MAETPETTEEAEDRPYGAYFCGWWISVDKFFEMEANGEWPSTERAKEKIYIEPAAPAREEGAPAEAGSAD